MLILKNSSLLSFNQFFTAKELLVFNALLFQYKVSKKEEIEFGDLKSKIGTTYSQNKHLKDTLYELTTKIVQPKYINKVKDIDSKFVSFFDYIKIDKKTIKFKFSSELLNYIDSKDGSFYHFDFKNAMQLKNLHSITIYELILDFTLNNQKSTTLYFNFNFLRKILGLEDKYHKNSEFKAKVINKIIKSFEIFDNIDIQLLEKNKSHILKITNNSSFNYNDDIADITNWLKINPDEVELYKETLLSSNENLDSKLLQLDHVKKDRNAFFAVFKYNSFLLDVEIIQEDLDIIFENTNEKDQDA